MRWKAGSCGLIDTITGIDPVMDQQATIDKWQASSDPATKR
jgi:hypothetical protein